MALVTAVRAVVRRDGRVLVFEDATGGHALPGGRLEPGESLLDGLARELREEVECEISAAPVRIGFVWLRHLGAKPDGYRYPHPDLVHVVYLVMAASDPIERAGEEYVRAPRFVPLDEALALPILEVERAFLTHPLVRSAA